MKHSRTRHPRAQRGAVLIIALIMLAVMTLFVISMLKTSVIELKIGGASQVASINLSNAEIAINRFIQLNNAVWAPYFLTNGKAAANANNYSGYGGDVIIVPTQLYCGSWTDIGTQIGATSLQAAQFDLQATATGALGFGGRTVVHQGVQTLAGAGSC